MSIKVEELLENGFKRAIANSRGFIFYVKKIEDGGVVVHKVDRNGESLGVEHFEEESIIILYNFLAGEFQ